MKREPLSLQNRTYEFINAHPLAALATIDSRKYPDVSMVYCIVHADLTLYFSCRIEAKKYVNLVQQPQVAMVFYNEETLVTVQLRGTASRVEEISLEQDILSDLTKLLYGTPAGLAPSIQLFEHGASRELAVIQVKPSEMTFASFDNKQGTQHTPFFQKVI